MVVSSTTRMIARYMQRSEAPRYLSGFFLSPPENFHRTEKIAIDIERDDEDIAIVITDLKAGGHSNESTLYTSKELTPPIFDEEGVITAFDLIKRRPGVDPFQDPNFAANALDEAFGIFRKLERKISRSIELMASQVFQTGTVTLRDKNGVALYTIDFKPKATHFPTVAINWSVSATAVPLTDLEALALVLRRDGRGTPKQLVFGKTAMSNFLATTQVKEALDNRRLDLGFVAPASRGQGATFIGRMWIGSYPFDLWTYDAWYRDPQSGLHVPYVADDKVIMLSEGARLDLTFGAIPNLRAPEERALAFIPPRISSSEGGLDLSTNAYFSANGKHLVVEAGTRPLTIPTAIDTFGCLDTVI